MVDKKVKVRTLIRLFPPDWMMLSEAFSAAAWRSRSSFARPRQSVAAFNCRYGIQSDPGKRGDVTGNRQRGLQAADCLSRPLRIDHDCCAMRQGLP